MRAGVNDTPRAEGGEAGTAHQSTAVTPKQFRDRRLFCVWALQLGLVHPERLVETVLRDFEGEC